MNRNLIYFFAIIFITAGIISCSKEYSLESGAFTKAKGSLHDGTGNCYPATVLGQYKAGAAVTDSNYLQVQVNVTTPGSYKISTDTVNGFSFQNSGIFTATGLQTIKLKAAGTPLINQNTDLLLSFDSTFCNVTVLVENSGTIPGGGTGTVSDTAWQFTEGSRYYHGSIDTAYTFDTVYQSVPIRSVNIQGSTPATGDSILLLVINFPGGNITPGSYTSTTTSIFRYLKSPDINDTLYSANLLIPSVNTTVQVSSYNTSTRIITGTFSGTAKNRSNNTVNITGGRFAAKLN